MSPSTIRRTGNGRGFSTEIILSIRKRRTEITPDYRSVRNKANRYLQDRASMKRETFSGIGFNFDAHDLCVIEGAGPIQDRTQEHLASSDMPVVVARKVRMKA